MIIFPSEKFYNDVKDLLANDLNAYITEVNNYYNDSLSLPNIAERNMVFGKAGEIMQGDKVQHDMLVFSLEENLEEEAEQISLRTNIEIFYISRGFIDSDNGELRWRATSRMINAILNCLREKAYLLQGLNGYKLTDGFEENLNDGRGYYSKTLTLTNLQSL